VERAGQGRAAAGPAGGSEEDEAQGKEQQLFVEQQFIELGLVLL
jgi:hypothetical protein